MGYFRKLSDIPCRIDFSIYGNVKSKVDEKSIELGYSLLRPPFIGEFAIILGNQNILKRITKIRKSAPCAYIEWLIRNFESYMLEDNSKRGKKHWNLTHVLAQGLGDYSPDLHIYNSEKNAITLELNLEKSYYFRAPCKSFASAVNTASDKLISLLKKNPGWTSNSRLEKLEDKILFNKVLSKGPQFFSLFPEISRNIAL